MKFLPDTANTLVVRTDFSDDAAWQRLCAASKQPIRDFQASVDCLSDPAYAGLSVERLRACIPEGSSHSFLLVVDRHALAHPEHPILVLDLYDEPGRTFRVIPTEMWGR